MATGTYRQLWWQTLKSIGEASVRRRGARVAGMWWQKVKQETETAYNANNRGKGGHTTQLEAVVICYSCWSFVLLLQLNKSRRSAAEASKSKVTHTPRWAKINGAFPA